MSVSWQHSYKVFIKPNSVSVQSFVSCRCFIVFDTISISDTIKVVCLIDFYSFYGCIFLYICILAMYSYLITSLQTKTIFQLIASQHDKVLENSRIFYPHDYLKFLSKPFRKSMAFQQQYHQ